MATIPSVDDLVNLSYLSISQRLGGNFAQRYVVSTHEICFAVFKCVKTTTFNLMFTFYSILSQIDFFTWRKHSITNVFIGAHDGVRSTKDLSSSTRKTALCVNHVGALRFVICGAVLRYYL